MEQAEANDNGNDAFELTLQEGLVVLTATLEGGETLEIGLAGREEACEIMCRFMASIDYEECG